MDAVDAVFEEARDDIRTELVFQHRAETVPLPVWQVSDERYAQARAVFEAGKDKTDQLSSPDYINWRVSRTLMARHAYQQEHPHYEAELHLLRLGDVAIATNPFELYTDYGVRIKARSPAVQTSVVQLTSDCAAYLPTRRAVARRRLQRPNRRRRGRPRRRRRAGQRDRQDVGDHVARPIDRRASRVECMRSVRE